MAQTAEDICDFVRLRRGNDLLWKWFTRTKLTKNKFISWAFKLAANPQEYKKSLPVNMRSAFAKDIPHMFYAKEIEDELIKQFIPMIYFIIRKFTVIQDEEHFYALGLNCVRYSIWSFRNVKYKCSFTTWCHNSLFMKIKGELSRESSKNIRRLRRNFICSNFTDVSVKHRSGILTSPLETMGKEDNMDRLQHEEAQELLRETIQSAGLNEEEIALLNALVLRFERNAEEKTVWYADFLKQFAHKFPNNRISKEGLRQKVVRLQKKIWFHWHKVRNLPIPEAPHFTLWRAG